MHVDAIWAICAGADRRLPLDCVGRLLPLPLEGGGLGEGFGARVAPKHPSRLPPPPPPPSRGEVFVPTIPIAKHRAAPSSPGRRGCYASRPTKPHGTPRKGARDHGHAGRHPG